MSHPFSGLNTTAIAAALVQLHRWSPQDAWTAAAIFTGRGLKATPAQIENYLRHPPALLPDITPQDAQRFAHLREYADRYRDEGGPLYARQALLDGTLQNPGGGLPRPAPGSARRWAKRLYRRETTG